MKKEKRNLSARLDVVHCVPERPVKFDVKTSNNPPRLGRRIFLNIPKLSQIDNRKTINRKPKNLQIECTTIFRRCAVAPWLYINGRKSEGAAISVQRNFAWQGSEPPSARRINLIIERTAIWCAGNYRYKKK